MITRMVDLKDKFIRNVIEFQIRYKQGQDYIKIVFEVSSIFQITGLVLEATQTLGNFFAYQQAGVHLRHFKLVCKWIVFGISQPAHQLVRRGQ